MARVCPGLGMPETLERRIALRFALVCAYCRTQPGNRVGRFTQMQPGRIAVRPRAQTLLRVCRATRDGRPTWPPIPSNPICATSLLRYISRATPDDVYAFMDRYAEAFADRAYRNWLDNLARRGKWTLYLERYDRRAPSTAACLHARALLKQAHATRMPGRAYVVDRSQVDDCDPLFKAWRRSDGIGDATAWARFVLVVEAGRVGLGSYLTRYLRAGDGRRLGEQMLALHRAPARLRRLNSVGGGHGRAKPKLSRTPSVLRAGMPISPMRRLARWRGHLELSADQQGEVRRSILRKHADNGRIELAALPWPPDEFGPEGTNVIPEAS